MSRLIALIVLFAVSSIAFAEQNRIELAKTITKESGFQRLIETSAGGGVSYRVEESQFYVVDLQTHSGVRMIESYIFESVNGELVFRATIPASFMRDRRIEIEQGQLTVSERNQDETKWSVIFILVN